MVPRARIELATQGFSVLRSTTELPRQNEVVAESVRPSETLVNRYEVRYDVRTILPGRVAQMVRALH